MNNEIILLDLFSGIGGFSAGLIDAGFKVKKHYYSETDKHAIACYKYNFKDSVYVGSVENVSGTELRRKHPKARFIITFGWPCQDNSIAGKRKGQVAGTRSFLLNEAVRIIREVQPDYFVAENVKGLYSVNDGKDFRDSLDLLSYLDTDNFQYIVEQQLCNTKWVLPQNRERTYFVGYPANRGWQGIFPITESDFGVNEGANETTNVRTLQGGGHSGGHHSGMTLLRWQNKEDGVVESDFAPSLRSSGGTDIRKMLKVLQRNRGYNKGGSHKISPPISSNSFEQNNVVVVSHYGHLDKDPVISENAPTLKSESHGHEPMVLYNEPYAICDSGLHREKQIRTDNLPPLRAHRGCDRNDTVLIVQDDLQIRDDRDNRSTLRSGRTSEIGYLGSSIRRLTEIECERLQGFSDNFTQFGDYDGVIKKIPKTQRYKLLGNAVTRDIVVLVGKKILLASLAGKQNLKE